MWFLKIALASNPTILDVIVASYTLPAEQVQTALSDGHAEMKYDAIHRKTYDCMAEAIGNMAVHCNPLSRSETCNQRAVRPHSR